MTRTHAFLIALVLAAAAVAGTLALLRTTQLGAQRVVAPTISAAQIAQRNHALDQAQAALLAQLRRKPPALPAVAAARATPATAAQAASVAQTVRYVRPKPIVRIVHRHGGEHESDGGGTQRTGAGGGLDD